MLVNVWIEVISEAEGGWTHQTIQLKANLSYFIYQADVQQQGRDVVNLPFATCKLLAMQKAELGKTKPMSLRGGTQSETISSSRLAE